ncbi:Gfo/Idh/MocA family protein [Microbacterium sp. NPDC055903]
MTTPSSVAVVGAGWRAEFILRIAASLPELFEPIGVVVRDPAKAERLSSTWGIPTYSTMAELLAHRPPDFLVLCVPRDASAELIAQAIAADVPVLTETPPAETIEGLIALHRSAGGARVQVAEQYHLQPLIAAQLSIARSGVIGDVSECRVSISHGYHAISIMRRMLGIGFEDAEIRALRFEAPLMGGPGRGGDPEEERVGVAETTIAHLDFGDRHGVYDWAPAQNRSWVRATRLLARGDRGEIDGRDVRYLADFRTPIQYTIRRVDAGHETNLEGHFLRGLIAGERWVYRNRFAPAGFIDDEIAVADCLVKMSDYARGGDAFYGLAEASQDHYLGMLVARAAESGDVVRSERQIWAE